MTPDEIRAARERVGLTQPELGQEIARRRGTPETPVHWTTVSRWERGVLPAPWYLADMLRDLERERMRS